MQGFRSTVRIESTSISLISKTSPNEKMSRYYVSNKTTHNVACNQAYTCCLFTEPVYEHLETQHNLYYMASSVNGQDKPNPAL